MIVAQTQRSQFKNCAETTLVRLLSRDNRQGGWVMQGSVVIGRLYEEFISKLLALFGKTLVEIRIGRRDAPVVTWGALGPAAAAQYGRLSECPPRTRATGGAARDSQRTRHCMFSDIGSRSDERLGDIVQRPHLPASMA